MSMKMMNAAYLVDNVALLSLQEKQDGVEFHCFDMAVFILLKLDFRSILQGLHTVQGRRITIRLSERREQSGAKFDIVEHWQVIRNNEYIS